MPFRKFFNIFLSLVNTCRKCFGLCHPIFTSIRIIVGSYRYRNVTKEKRNTSTIVQHTPTIKQNVLTIRQHTSTIKRNVLTIKRKLTTIKRIVFYQAWKGVIVTNRCYFSSSFNFTIVKSISSLVVNFENENRMEVSFASP